MLAAAAPPSFVNCWQWTLGAARHGVIPFPVDHAPPSPAHQGNVKKGRSVVSRLTSPCHHQLTLRHLWRALLTCLFDRPPKRSKPINIYIRNNIGREGGQESIVLHSTQPYPNDETPACGVLGGSFLLQWLRGKASTQPYPDDETLPCGVLGGSVCVAMVTGGKPPPDHTRVKKHLRVVSPMLYFTMCALAIIGIIAGIACLIFNYRNRQRRLVCSWTVTLNNRRFISSLFLSLSLAMSLSVSVVCECVYVLSLPRCCLCLPLQHLWGLHHTQQHSKHLLSPFDELPPLSLKDDCTCGLPCQECSWWQKIYSLLLAHTQARWNRGSWSRWLKILPWHHHCHPDVHMKTSPVWRYIPGDKQMTSGKKNSPSTKN